MELGRVGVRDRQLDEIRRRFRSAPRRSPDYFLTRTTICVSRTEIGVMRSLQASPTQLAVDERVTQPVITLLVNRLADRGWMKRIADPTDGRCVLVKLTAVGEDALERLRSEYRAMLHEQMATLDDDDVDTLARSIEILDGLIDRLTERYA